MTERSILARVTIGLAALLVAGVLGTVATLTIHQFALYDPIPYGDVIAHFGAGLGLAALLYWVGWLTDVPTGWRVAVIVTLAVLAAVGWEVGELLYWAEASKFPSSEMYWEDTGFDVVTVIFATFVGFEIAEWRGGGGS